MHVKICGLKSVEAIDAALARGATHIGFVHFPKSPRHLEIAEMARLSEHVGDKAATVVVTVDPDDSLVRRLAGEVRPDWLQLHGGETPERLAELRERTGIRLMKALAVASRGDLMAVGSYPADRILLDAKQPKGSELPGGNGVAFDWSLLAALDPSCDYMLSGGLDAQNVGDAIRRVRPRGIDVSSGVESAPGIKDVGLIHRFFDALDAAGSDEERKIS